MNSPAPLRLVMAPLALCLSLAATDTVSAAPAKTTPPPATETVQEAPAKPSFFRKLNPFRKKSQPEAASPVQENSKKPPVAAPAPPKVNSLARARTIEPATALTPVAPKEEEEKTGFFARLKARLDREPDTPALAPKPDRPDDWKDRWVVTEAGTGFFEFGPSQANGADRRLARGEVVKLVQSNRGWARVELENGKQGYIGTDQMRQAALGDFEDPVVPQSNALAAAAGAAQAAWAPAPPPPDLPDTPMAPGVENSLFLLPPLEFEGTELKRSSLRIPGEEPPLLSPGDPLPVAAPADLDASSEPSLPEPSETKPETPAPAVSGDDAKAGEKDSSEEETPADEKPEADEPQPEAPAAPAGGS